MAAPQAAAASARHGKGAEDKSKTPPEWKGWAGKRVTLVLDSAAAAPQLPRVISGAVVETAYDHWLIIRWGAKRLILNKRYVVAGVEEGA